jgi:hypothetical protein
MNVTAFSIRHSERSEESLAAQLSDELHEILRFAQNDNIRKWN